MKLTAAIFALALASTAHADPVNAVVRVALSDGLQYDVTVARDGTPTTMMVHDGAETVALHLRVVDQGRLRYEVKRSGPHAFVLDGEVAPPRGRPAVIGHVPYAGGACDVRLRMTDE